MTEKVDKSKSNTQVKNLPKDAQIIMSIMKEVGITEYEPRVINQLLEFTYRYVTSALEDARTFASHAKKKTIDLDDVRLSVHAQLDKSYTTPPPREILLEIARVKNANPLPLIKPHCGLRLPPDRYCLSSCNYRLKTASNNSTKLSVTSTPGNKNINKASHNVVMKRPPVSKPNVAPKPVLKFTAGTKVVAKPAVRVTSGPAQAPVKMEVDSMSGAHKRKREDDDLDI